MTPLEWAPLHFRKGGGAHRINGLKKRGGGAHSIKYGIQKIRTKFRNINILAFLLQLHGCVFIWKRNDIVVFSPAVRPARKRLRRSWKSKHVGYAIRSGSIWKQNDLRTHPYSCNPGLKAAFHPASFETPVRPMRKDQSVPPTHYTFLGRHHFIFKHWMYRILQNR